MSLSEYAVMFVLVTIMGAGIPGPGDASLIAAGALAGVVAWAAEPVAAVEVSQR